MKLIYFVVFWIGASEGYKRLDPKRVVLAINCASDVKLKS